MKNLIRKKAKIILNKRLKKSKLIQIFLTDACDQLMEFQISSV